MNPTAARDPARTAQEPEESALPSVWNAFRGLWALTWQGRLGYRRWPMLLGTVLLVPTLAFLTLRPGQEDVFLHWLIEFYLFLLLPLYCLGACGAIIRDELQGSTLGFLTTRPMSRARLFLLKFACELCWLQILALGIALLMWLAGTWRGIPDAASVMFIFGGVQFLAIAAYGALSALLGLLHQRYVVMGILYGFIVELGIGRIPTNINNLSMARHARTLLANHEAFQEQYGWSAEGTLFSATAMLAATAIFLVTGAVLFTWREYQLADESHK